LNHTVVDGSATIQVLLAQLLFVPLPRLTPVSRMCGWLLGQQSVPLKPASSSGCRVLPTVAAVLLLVFVIVHAHSI
jgi:hypothetical protein